MSIEILTAVLFIKILKMKKNKNSQNTEMDKLWHVSWMKHSIPLKVYFLKIVSLYKNL